MALFSKIRHTEMWIWDPARISDRNRHPGYRNGSYPRARNSKTLRTKTEHEAARSAAENRTVGDQPMSLSARHGKIFVVWGRFYRENTFQNVIFKGKIMPVTCAFPKKFRLRRATEIRIFFNLLIMYFPSPPPARG